jgi:hypothetical protein
VLDSLQLSPGDVGKKLGNRGGHRRCVNNSLLRVTNGSGCQPSRETEGLGEHVRG